MEDLKNMFMLCYMFKLSWVDLNLTQNFKSEH